MNADPLWPHFKPLWTDLVAIDSTIKAESTFAKAKTFLNEQFVGERTITEPIKRNWQPADFETINAVLQGWFN